MRRLAPIAPCRPIALAALAVAAIVATATIVGCSSGESPLDSAASPDGVQELYLGDVLEGGRTYRLPGGSWLIDVPEGMRLYYSFFRPSADPAAGALHGLRDLETGSFIGIEQHTGEVQRHAFGSTSADVRAAEARLDRIEVAFRRSP